MPGGRTRSGGSRLPSARDPAGDLLQGGLVEHLHASDFASNDALSFEAAEHPDGGLDGGANPTMSGWLVFTAIALGAIGVVLGLVPTTGVPLPLMSYGGSSLVSTMAALGLALNVRMRRLVN